MFLHTFCYAIVIQYLLNTIHFHIYVFTNICIRVYVLFFLLCSYSFPSRSALAIFLTPLAGLLPLVKLPEAAPFSESQSVNLVQIKSILFLFEQTD